MNTNGDGHTRKSPEQLEREIDEERAHINHTLDVLEGKLSPGELFDKVLGYTRRNGGEFSRNLVNTVTHNPIPTLMTAVGITWMLYQQNRPGSSESGNGWSYGEESYGLNGSGFSDTEKRGLKDKASHLKDSVGNAKQHAGDKAHQAAEGIRQRADRIKHSTQSQAQKVSEGFNYMLEEQPLALGALGIAIGALLGGSLPSTRREDRLMGEASDRVADKASHVAESAYEKAKGTGKQVKDDAKAEVKSEIKPENRSRPAL